MRLNFLFAALMLAFLAGWSQREVLGQNDTSSPSTDSPSTSSPTSKSPTTRAPTTPAPTFSSNCPDDPTDTDGDGISDCYDKCPVDFNKATPGLCGCGVSDTLVDNNGDGIPDCPNGATPKLIGVNFGAPNAVLSSLVLVTLMFLGRMIVVA